MKLTAVLTLFSVLFELSTGLPKSNTKGYYSWILGNPGDVQTTTKGVTMIQGGGTDVDPAMAWMLSNSGGGDIVVIRDGKNYKEPTPTADAYNPYFYSELGVKVDSVETIFLNSRDVAENPEVVRTIKNAECLFFTGGDQNYYYNYIKGSAMEDAIIYLQKQKRVPIGGTSAGCAIQGQYVYTAEHEGVLSQAALDNPYNIDVTIGTNFLQGKYLKDTLTDTHYTQRDRHGRHTVFLARLSKDYSVTLPKGIGLDEKTAVAIDEDGYGNVYGSGTAYFIIQYKSSTYPESCKANNPLDWYRDQKALEVYSIQATLTGNKYFDLMYWSDNPTVDSVDYWYADRGYFGSVPEERQSRRFTIDRSLPPKPR